MPHPIYKTVPSTQRRRSARLRNKSQSHTTAHMNTNTIANMNTNTNTSTTNDFTPLETDSAAASTRRRVAPTIVSNSPVKRLRRSQRRVTTSTDEIVTPKHITFDEKNKENNNNNNNINNNKSSKSTTCTDNNNDDKSSTSILSSVFRQPLPQPTEDPCQVLLKRQFYHYGEEHLQHLFDQEQRECLDCYNWYDRGWDEKGTLDEGLVDSRIEFDIYYANETEWRYVGEPWNGPRHSYEYKPRYWSLLDTEPQDIDLCLPRQGRITAKMRNILVNWLSEVCTEYKISMAASHLGVTLLDAYLARATEKFRQVKAKRQAQIRKEEGRDPYELFGWGQQTDSENDDDDEEEEEVLTEFDDDGMHTGIVQREDFQALGCACLWIGAKMQDTGHTVPSPEDFCYISDKSFTESKLSELERRVCFVLGFGVKRVTPYDYQYTFLRACGVEATAVMERLYAYLLELSRVSFDLSYRPPSLIAAAALYLARVTLGLKQPCSNKTVHQHPHADSPPSSPTDDNNNRTELSYWTEPLQHVTGYSVLQLQDAVLLLHKYQMATKGSIFNKHRRRSQSYVAANHPAPRLDDMEIDFPECVDVVYDMVMDFPEQQTSSKSKKE